MRSIHAAVVAAALAGLSVAGCTRYEPERVTERVVYIPQVTAVAPIAKPLPADESAAKPLPDDAPQGYVVGPPAPQPAPVYETPPAAPAYQPAPPPVVVEQPVEYPPVVMQSTTIIEQPVYVDRTVYQPYPVYVGNQGWYEPDRCDNRWNNRRDDHRDDRRDDHRDDHRDVDDHHMDDHHIVNTHTGYFNTKPTLKKEYPTTPDSGRIIPLASPPTPTPAKQTIPIKPAKGGAPVAPAPQNNTPSFHHTPAPAPKPAPVPQKAPIAPKQSDSASGKNSKGADSKSAQQDPPLPPKFRRN